MLLIFVFEWPLAVKQDFDDNNNLQLARPFPSWIVIPFLLFLLLLMLLLLLWLSYRFFHTFLCAIIGTYHRWCFRPTECTQSPSVSPSPKVQKQNQPTNKDSKSKRLILSAHINVLVLDDDHLDDMVLSHDMPVCCLLLFFLLLYHLLRLLFHLYSRIYIYNTFRICEHLIILRISPVLTIWLDYQLSSSSSSSERASNNVREGAPQFLRAPQPTLFPNLWSYIYVFQVVWWSLYSNRKHGKHIRQLPSNY